MMKNSHASHPIGIFDSGIGGLVVTQEIARLLPHEDIIYFGDTAHFPYGDKSTTSIQEWSIKITEWLLQKNCKLVLIACNSASTAAYEQIKNILSDQSIIVNVIDPVIQALQSFQKNFPDHQNHKKHKTGLIGTRQTVNSGMFKKKIAQHCETIELIQHPANLLASAIEEFGVHPVTDSILEAYLSCPAFREIDSLILACTHYPIIHQRIADFFSARGQTVSLIDPSREVAKSVYETLQKQNLCHEDVSHIARRHFYVSDYTESFAASARLFFDSAITLEYFPLWEESNKIPA